MPYIKQEDRKELHDSILPLSIVLSNRKWKKGEFNYCISMLLKSWVRDKKLSYDTLSDITGVLNDIKTEFERKVVAPYEDTKIKDNGGVYEPQSDSCCGRCG